MNYRQWKKNYKKKHGVNPPLAVDKRKQAKVMRRTLKNISSYDLSSVVNSAVATIINGVSKAVDIVADGLKNISVTFQEVAKSLVG